MFSQQPRRAAPGMRGRRQFLHTAPPAPPASNATLGVSNQTLRLIVHASVGGSAVRVRLSNEMGSTPMRIGDDPGRRAAAVGPGRPGDQPLPARQRAGHHHARHGLAGRLRLLRRQPCFGALATGAEHDRLLALPGRSRRPRRRRPCHDCLERFDRDVLATTGAGWLFVLIGINDIVYSPASNPLPPADLIAGYQQLIGRARLRGLRAIGARDAVVDFDQVLRDPAQPTRLNAAYDGGDHLPPNDAGYQAMAQAVPLGLFATI